MEKLFRIKGVGRFRSLQAWSPSNGLRQFATYNLVYGANGTGKTTLAALLYQCANGIEVPGFQVAVGSQADQMRTVASATDRFWKNVHVFNSEYVDKNLRFEDSAGSTTEALLVLGEVQVESERERTGATARLAEIDRELPLVERVARQAATTRERVLTDIARTISEELQDVSSRFAGRSYRAPQVRALLDQGVPDATGIDVARDLRLAQGTSMPQLPVPTTASLDATGFALAVQEAAAATAQSVTIDELVANPELSRWVGHGVELHEKRDSCLFCEGAIPQDRRVALAAHFDTSLGRLEARLDGLASDSQALLATCLGALSDMPTAEQVTDHVRDEYSSAIVDAEKRRDALADEIRILQGVIEAKRDQLFASSSPAIKTEASFSTAHITELIERHNEYVGNLASYKSSAAERVERARIAAIADEYQSASAEATSQESKRTRLAEEREDLRVRIERLNVVDLDPGPIAERLNTDLWQLLGRDDLRFSPYERGYRIMRNEAPATHLSEGERNAISLLYFLRSLESHDSDQVESLIVIDDPVSSLDHNSLFAASTLLWSRLVAQSGQLIILTHNFEFFRTWCYQLQSANRVLSKGDKQYYSLYELRAGTVSMGEGTYRREPVMVDWPADFFMQRRLRSEYHYLFWTVGNTVDELDASPTPELEIQAAAILPNACRRLLESFLAFHHPAAIGNLHDQVLAVNAPGMDKDVRTRVLRFVHTYSHSEEADITRPLARPDTIANVRAVLQFMKSVDGVHFDGMCKALEITAVSANRAQ